MHLKRDIDLYLAEGLPPGAEQALRQHLGACETCRRYYDDEVRLRRALAGAPDRPCRVEEARLQRLVLSQAGLTLPALARPPLPQRRLAERWRENPWRFALPMGAAALALIVGLWTLHPWRAEPMRPQPQPQLDSANGSVLAARLNQAKAVTLDGIAAKPGSPIQAGVAIAVAADGLAELELVRGGRARLFPGTRLKLTPRGEAMELDEGKVWCEVEAARGRFIVRTERGEARVLGTSFVVEDLSSGDTEVRVLSGAVEVEDAGHRGMVLVKGGQRTRLLSGASPARALRYDSHSDSDDWEQALKKLGREIESTFKKLKSLLR